MSGIDPLTSNRRVVITGLGAVTALGRDTEAFWQALLAGQSGVDAIQRFDTTDFDVHFAAEARDFVPEDYMERKEAKRMDRFAQLAVGAARLAAESSRIPINDDTADRIGVLIGSGIGGLHTLEDQHRVLIERGPSRLSPFFIPMMISDMASGQVSIILGARGPNSAIVTACATGTHTIGDAYHIVRRGDADAMLAGGSEAAICPLGLGGFCAARALSTRNDDPKGASRPFDATRDGFVMGEGAGVLVVEEREHAIGRGATIYAEIVGYGLSGDAYHITQPAPGGQGAARSIRMALATAGLQPTDIDYINAHGTSTIPNDKLETAAIKAVFGEAAYSVSISSTKSMTGHLLGAAGTVEAIACVLAIRDGVIPPTINLHSPDPECDLDYTPNTAKERKVRFALSNSFGFGGHNATIILAAPDAI